LIIWFQQMYINDYKKLPESFIIQPDWSKRHVYTRGEYHRVSFGLSFKQNFERMNRDMWDVALSNYPTLKHIHMVGIDIGNAQNCTWSYEIILEM